MSRKEGIIYAKEYLSSIGYSILNERNNFKRCIEIQAMKDGIMYQFSVMVLSPNPSGVYFGATNSIEWWEGVRTQDKNHKFFFIIVRTDMPVGPKKIMILSPDEILKYTSIPSLKFNVSINPNELAKTRQKYSVNQIMEIIKNTHNNEENEKID